jgi:hypothetical protein
MLGDWVGLAIYSRAVLVEGQNLSGALGDDLLHIYIS